MITAAKEKKPVSGVCSRCKQPQTIYVYKEDWDAWLGGKVIQEAFPYLSADERELLISGICGTCFDNMFKE